MLWRKGILRNLNEKRYRKDFKQDRNKSHFLAREIMHETSFIQEKIKFSNLLEFFERSKTTN